jgi:hypothetical protein
MADQEMYKEKFVYKNTIISEAATPSFERKLI